MVAVSFVGLGSHLNGHRPQIGCFAMIQMSRWSYFRDVETQTWGKRNAPHQMACHQSYRCVPTAPKVEGRASLSESSISTLKYCACRQSESRCCEMYGTVLRDSLAVLYLAKLNTIPEKFFKSHCISCMHSFMLGIVHET